MIELPLRERLHEHLALVRLAAQDNEFIDVRRAEELHDLLGRALDALPDLDVQQRRELASAIDYLVRVDDDEDDLRSPIGFDDDAEVVEAALARIRPSSGGTGSGFATR
ncbi:hypothetical protein GCM10023200_19460 [Actinomycetospora chlora]|uniref:Uncharacterized protein n=1 Tax=Actinomycetospora chlora TaxID=663608 RepID=A0ABP9ATC4_9PSEU